MIHFEDASKQQLLQICLHEDCSLDYKYEAAAELQMRQWHDDYLQDLVRMWGEGKTSFQIAIELNIDHGAVTYRLNKLGLYGSRKNYIPHTKANHSIMVEIEGETLCLSDWSKKTNIKYTTLVHRYKKGDRGTELIRKVREKTSSKGA